MKEEERFCVKQLYMQFESVSRSGEVILGYYPCPARWIFFVGKILKVKLVITFF